MLQFPFRGLLGGQEALVSRLRCRSFGPKGHHRQDGLAHCAVAL